MIKNFTRKRKQRCVYLGIILVMLFLISFMHTSTPNQGPNISDFNYTMNDVIDNKDVKSQYTYYDYYTDEWLDNGNFTAGTDPWYNETEGDDSDIMASYSDGAANYEVLGDNGTFSEISGTPQSGDWKRFRNTLFPILPDSYGINTNGLEVAHEFDEDVNQTRNTPSVRYKRNITMPVNMKDYIITSASFDALINGTADTNCETPSDTFLSDGGYAAVYDYVRYYVLISDLEEKEVYEIAFNKTRDLGFGDQYRRGSGTLNRMYDTLMKTVDPDVLEFYLTRVFSHDGYNFTITLGIDIYCEDNYDNYDLDEFTSLLIKECNLTFTYEKRMDQGTALSWNQVGYKIEGANVDVTEAKLNFQYKVNETWPTALSPNSDIRIEINDTKHAETVELSQATMDFKEVEIDVTNLVIAAGKNVNISVSIQVYLADALFFLDRHIKISIDNVSLEITYSVATVEDITTIDLFLDQDNKTLPKYIEMFRGDPLNITVHYKNSTNGHIVDASVNLTGAGPDKELDEDKALGHYSITIDTIDFPNGENYFKVIAQKKYFETQEISFTVDLKKRSFYIDKVFLNNSEDTYLEIPWNELLYINITLNDTSTNNFINDATVKLVKAGFEMNFSESNQNQYNLTLNSAKLALDRNSFSITAEKENYTSSSKPITIVVTERETLLDVYIDTLDTDSFLSYNASIGQYLNITVKYKDDITKAFIKNADVNMFELGDPTPNPLLQDPNHPDQYNITLLTDDLGIGNHYMQITAEKANHTTILENFKIFIEERGTNFDLLLNSTQPPVNYVVELEERINITVFFEDSLTNNFLDKANVTLIGYDNLTKHPDFDQYNITLLGSDLKTQGFNFLTVFAYKENYQSHSETIRVEVVEKNTSVELYFDGNNVTLTPTITLPIGKNLLITTKFVDKNNVSIQGATVRLIINSLDIILKWNPATKDYNCTLNTNLLGIGNKLLPIVCEKTNYQTRSRDLGINIRKVKTDITTEDGKSKIEIKPGENAKITIEVLNLDFGGKISDCDVTYDWKHGDGDADEENDGEYEFELENVPEGTYTITIKVYKAGSIYEFEEYEITLVVKRSAEEDWPLWLALMIIGGTTLALASYILLHHKFKVPPPIRRLRKFRKTLKKEDAPNVKHISFDSAVTSKYEKKKALAEKASKGAGKKGELLEEGVEFAAK